MGSITDSRAALEFSAYFTSNSGSQFLLTDLDTGSKSGWLAVGDSFHGHVLVKFEADRGTLTLDHAGTSALIRLKDSRTVDGGVETSTNAEIKIIVSNEGVVLLDGKSINQLALLEYFEELVRSGKQIALALQAPPNATQKSAESTRKVLNAFKVSGAKGSILFGNVQLTK